MQDISATSALVLIMAGQDSYQSHAAKHFFSQLNLAEGEELYQKCQKICDHYDNVIKNRKHGIAHLIHHCFKQQDDWQVIISGAGFDPLGLDIVTTYPQAQVFELDIDNMLTKSTMLKKLYGESNLHCIETNLIQADICQPLSAHGWQIAKPTLLIMEGISYYLSVDDTCNLLQSIQPQKVIFEFLKPYHHIAADKTMIPQQIYGMIIDHCQLSGITQYDYEQISTLFNFKITTQYSMQQLEQMRTGHNQFFPSPESGWIEVSLLTQS